MPTRVAELLHLVHQVARQQHGHAVVGEPPDQDAHVAHARRVEAGGRLVEQQQPRRAQQRPGDAEALAHAVRVAADAVAGAVGQVDRVERAVDARRRRRRRRSAATSSRFLRPRQVRVEPRCLDEAGDAVERGGTELQRVPSEQPGAARGRADQPEQHPQRRRLAGAVRPEEPVDVAGRDHQVDVVDRAQLAVDLREAARLDRQGVRHHATRSRAAASMAAAGTDPSTV